MSRFLFVILLLPLLLRFCTAPGFADEPGARAAVSSPGCSGASRKSVEKSAEPDAPPSDREKRYDGRTLSEWQQHLKRIDPRDPDSKADVPGMRALLRDTQVPWYTRRQAALTLGRMGDYAEAAVADLIGVLQTEPGPVRASDENGVRDAVGIDRSWAIKALAIYGDVASAATDELVRIANDPQSTFGERAACLEALAQIGVAHPGTIPALLSVLRDAEQLPNLDESERRFMELLAVEGLGVIGPGAATAVPQLIQATRADSTELRRLAATTLGQIGPEAEVAIPALVDLVFDDDSEAVRDAAAVALPACGPRAQTALRLILEDESVAQRVRAAKAISSYTELPESLREPLAELLDDPAATVRVEAAASWWTTTRDASRVLPVLLAALEEPDRQVRLQAVRLFGKLGSAARTVRAELQALTQDSRPYVQQAAEKVLQQLEQRQTP